MRTAAIAFLFFLPMMFIGKKDQRVHDNEDRTYHLTGQSKKDSYLYWDTATLKRISPPGSAASYPRMLQLSNGCLLVAYASAGNIVGTRSFDSGKSWSLPAVLAPKEEGVNMDTPDLLQLKNGRLLLCYATRPQGALRGTPDTAKKFEIRVRQSSDDGQTWKDQQILYSAGYSFRNGCWEPSMVQLPDGDIQLFFADEGVYTSSDEQNISLFRSRNGLTWSDKPQIVSFRKGSRDGMPVPIWLKQEKKVVIAIEDPGHRNFKPYTIRSAGKGRWRKVTGGEDADRSYALARPLEDSIYAGAPYLRQLSTGETVLSYQSTEARMGNRDNDAVMHVAIGDAKAKNFRNVSAPFPVPEGYHALWSSVCILKGDVVVALTSTNGFSRGRPEIWMVKGMVVRQGRNGV